MSKIKYEIGGKADVKPIKETASSLDSLGATGSGVQSVMVGMQNAVDGNTSAVFNLARGFKYLWEVLKKGKTANIWLLAITVAVTALMWAFNKYTKKQAEAAKAAKEAQEKFVNLITRLRELRKVTREALTLDAYNKQLDGLSKHFQDAADKAKVLADNAAALRQVQLQQQLAAVDADTAGRQTGDPASDAAVNLAADRRRQELQTAAELADLEARRADLADQRARAEQQIKYFEGARKTSQTQIQRSVGRVQTAESDVAAARAGDPEKHIEAVKALDAQRAAHQKLIEAEAARQKVIDVTVAAQREVLAQLVAENSILDENVKLVDAQRKAREAELALRQKQLAASDTDTKRQAQIADLKKKSAALQKAADAQAEAAAARIAQLREVEAEAGEAYAEGRKQITDPAYARQQRIAERDKARDERAWNNKVSRAQRAAARAQRVASRPASRGGRITKDTRDILVAARNQRLAGAAGKAAGSLEEQMAADTKSSAASLKNIESKIEQLLTTS